MMKRIITGLAVSGCWLLILYLQSFNILATVIIIIGAIALNEYFTMTMPKAGMIHRYLLLSTAMLPLAASLANHLDLVYLALITALVTICFFIIATYKHWEKPFSKLANIIFAVFYISLCASYLPLIMAMDNGAVLLLILSGITAGSDTGAYFAGKNFGRHKLSPLLSPGKTVEGLFGGLICGTGVAVLIGFLMLKDYSLVPLAISALILSGLGVVGDLTESMIKREMGAKDSGQILPGHGGILDRIDSILICAPIYYYLIHFGII